MKLIVVGKLIVISASQEILCIEPETLLPFSPVHVMGQMNPIHTPDPI